MKRGNLGILLGILTSIWSCSSENSSSTSAGVAGSAGADSGAATTVECTHPGAGKPTGDGKCACATTLDIGGEWSAKRTCREGDVCPVRNKEETVIFSQNGTSIKANKGDAYSLTGTLCNDVLVWTGGEKDGLNPECGLVRFTDATHYLIDSCYIASGECARTHAEGCPGQKGQCTGTGAKKPETSASIQKVICN
jgi:hypothetical protein